MFGKRKEKGKIKEQMLFEISETLMTICLYLESDGRYTHNPQARLMRTHFETLGKLSEPLRKELYPIPKDGD